MLVNNLNANLTIYYISLNKKGEADEPKMIAQ